MIERFYVKDYLSFKESELEFDSGLIVFTGTSGSGKSILMNAILASLGHASCEAALCEACTTWRIDEDDTGIQNNDINIFKYIKKEKARYFINNQSLSKKSLSSIASKYLRYLSLKDFSDFENNNLLSILDGKIDIKFGKINKLKQNYKNNFLKFEEVKKQLNILRQEQAKIVELKEFTAFEIKKIQDIDPKIDEDVELLKIKRELSKKEKVLKNIESASEIFNYEHLVSSVFNDLDIDSNFFDDSMNELRSLFQNIQEKFSALDDVDIENILNRIEELGELKRRYGTIQEALEYKKQKEIELQKYKNIEIDKEDLQKKYDELSSKVIKIADEISNLRSKALVEFNKDLNNYLNDLYLKNAKISIQKIKHTISGQDKLDIILDNTMLSKISTGEFNRLRLAILALKIEFVNDSDGVLILDEIDANLSGEESMSVAKVLKKLSKKFQIFVISHQPQLTSMGDQHFLVQKKNNESYVKLLSFDERVHEIARIVSGLKITLEAKSFAKDLLSNRLEY